MGLTQIHLTAFYSIAIVLVVSLTFASGDDVILQKRSDENPLEHLTPDDRPSKRPFCNTFTGCGRKRNDESMDSLVELNSEPAVEELSKRILSEAKLWEAIQEARAEMEREREEGANIISRNVPLALAMSNYRRKRAATEFEQKSANRKMVEEKSER